MEGQTRVKTLPSRRTTYAGGNYTQMKGIKLMLNSIIFRILEMNLSVKRPTHISTGLKTFKHVHNKKERPRDYKQYGQQRKVGQLTW